MDLSLRAVDRLRRRWLMGSLSLGAAGLRAGSARGQTEKALGRSAGEGMLPSLAGATGWLNSPPITADDLRGRVVLVDFWTYTCINWQRTLPYVRAWAEKYRKRGLVVIGVHTPEFGFEKDLDNVRRQAAALRVAYPVAVDSNRAIWSAFGNQYWPALYFIDARGTIRHRHFGEGDYERSERMIQQLLIEAGGRDVGTELVRPVGTGSQAPADWTNLRTPETYVGADRAEHFASPGGIRPGEERPYTVPGGLELGHWALAGTWTVDTEAARLARAGGRIACRFHARDLHLVMGPAVRGQSVRFCVVIDGQPPGASHGADINAEGNGTVVEPRLHQLVRQVAPVIDRQFEIEFADAGVKAFAFTFG